MPKKANHDCEDGIRVKLFAGFRDLFARTETCVPATEAPDVARLFARLCETPAQEHGLMTSSGALREGLIILVNGRSAGLLGGAEARLRAGDEVALFPPMGGG